MDKTEEYGKMQDFLSNEIELFKQRIETTKKEYKKTSYPYKYQMLMFAYSKYLDYLLQAERISV